MKMTHEEYMARREAIQEEFERIYDPEYEALTESMLYRRREAAWEKRDADLDALWFEYIDGMEVGDHANVKLWSDVEPVTVISRTAKTITVRYDKAEKDPEWTPEWITGGFSAICTNTADQKWIISEDPDGHCEVFRRRKNGWFNKSDCKLTPGWRKYYDYNF